MEDRALEIKEDRPLTAIEVRKQVNLIQEVMKEVMKENEHYGKVPGCGNKPTLLKPGAEKLVMTFRLGAEYEELPGSQESDAFVLYKINCKLIHIPTGQVVGNGRGTCNSKEKKYRTRSVYPNKANDEEKAIGKPETRNGTDGKKYDVLIVPQDPWDVQNTIYKMACKRALVAAVLNATAASDIFTQDIEDLPEGTMIEDEPTTHKPPVEMPQENKPDAPKTTNGGAVISEPQRKRLFAISRQNGHTEVEIKDFLKNNYGIEHTNEILKEHYEYIVSHFEAKKNA
jgi:hypothetical protein